MYYENLTLSIQSLLMLRFEFIGKLFLILIGLIFSIYYIFISYKQQEATGYLLKSFVRILLYLLSVTFLFLLPLSLFFLYPTVSLDYFLRFLLIGYTIFIIIFLAIFLLNAFYLAPLMLLKMGKYEPFVNKQSGGLYGKLANTIFQKSNKKFDIWLNNIKNGKN